MSAVWRWSQLLGDPLKDALACSGASPELLTAAAEIQRDGKAADSIRMTMARSLAWVGVPALRRTVSGRGIRPFDAEEWLRGNGTLYVINSGELSAAAPLFRAVVEKVHRDCVYAGSLTGFGRIPNPVKRQGPRFRAFYGCMFYALMRPSEVAALTRPGCHLPDSGWGYLVFADSSPAPGKAYTDDGQVHEHRGLKGRTKGRPSPRARRPVRKVPIPPELTELLRAHIEQFGVAPDGRLFRSESGNPLQPSTWWQVWQKVRAASLTADQLASPLMKRPYDLRHSGITWRLNSGVPAIEVAAWAGHSVEMLMRVYARCVVGLEGVWIGRMDDALHLEEDR